MSTGATRSDHVWSHSAASAFVLIAVIAVGLRVGGCLADLAIALVHASRASGLTQKHASMEAFDDQDEHDA